MERKSQEATKDKVSGSKHVGWSIENKLNNKPKLW
jgi:hypothetical protein